ncbi:MAG: diaminopimelate epimerase [Acidobacteria bacterium]|nr:diaminopimelate epimerase [Acidobacteriota bacterium]
MIKFTKAHAYGNDFLYVEAHEAPDGSHDVLARELCDRHTGIGADGLILFTRKADGASMVLFNADGGRAEVSGNGVRALAALLLRDDMRDRADVTIDTEGGVKQLTRVARMKTQQTFRAAMGLPENLRPMPLSAAGEALQVVAMTFGNPQSVVLGPLPDEARFRRLGPALERHEAFPEGTNVEFAIVESATRVRILIWERGVGPTLSSGTGSCAALIAAAAFGGAGRDAEVIAPGGSQRVEWRDESVYLTGWAEVLFDGVWVGR